MDYDPGASEVNQINRIKLMMSVAFANLKGEKANLPEVGDEEALPPVGTVSCHPMAEAAATKDEK